MTRVIEIDEAGRLVLPPELLPDIAPRTRYVIETKDEKLVVQPEQWEAATPNKSAKKAITSEEWMEEWRALAEEVTKAWNSDKTATEVISEMRR